MFDAERYEPDSFEMKSLDSLSRRLKGDKEAERIIAILKEYLAAKQNSLDVHKSIVKTYEGLLDTYQRTGLCQVISFEHVTLRVALLGRYEYNEN